MKKSKCAAYLIGVLESESIDKTIEMNQHFPCVPFYSGNLQFTSIKTVVETND